MNTWHVAPGDPTHVFVGVAKPINCHSQDRAKLIAAAPDLLERLMLHADAACLGWSNRFNLPDCQCGPCLDRAAIAKAI